MQNSEKNEELENIIDMLDDSVDYKEFGSNDYVGLGAIIAISFFCVLISWSAPRSVAQILFPAILIPSFAIFVLKNKRAIFREFEFAAQGWMLVILFFAIVAVPVGILYVLALLHKHGLPVMPILIFTTLIIVILVLRSKINKKSK